MEKLCTDCRYSVEIDYGASNWSTEGADVFCLKFRFPDFPVDRYYGEEQVLKVAARCNFFSAGKNTKIDVDREEGNYENYTNDPEIKTLLRSDRFVKFRENMVKKFYDVMALWARATRDMDFIFRFNIHDYLFLKTGSATFYTWTATSQTLFNHTFSQISPTDFSYFVDSQLNSVYLEFEKFMDGYFFSGFIPKEIKEEIQKEYEETQKKGE